MSNMLLRINCFSPPERHLPNCNFNIPPPLSAKFNDLKINYKHIQNILLGVRQFYASKPWRRPCFYCSIKEGIHAWPCFLRSCQCFQLLPVDVPRILLTSTWGCSNNLNSGHHEACDLSSGKTWRGQSYHWSYLCGD